MRFRSSTDLGGSLGLRCSYFVDRPASARTCREIFRSYMNWEVVQDSGPSSASYRLCAIYRSGDAASTARRETSVPGGRTAVPPSFPAVVPGPAVDPVFDRLQREREARLAERERRDLQTQSDAERLRSDASPEADKAMSPEARLARAKAQSGGDFDQTRGSACVAHFLGAARQMMQRAKYCGLAAEFINTLTQETARSETFEEALLSHQTLSSIRITVKPEDPTWRNVGDGAGPVCRLPLRENLGQETAYRDCARVYVCGMRALRAASVYARMRPEMSCEEAAQAGLKISPVPRRTQ